MNELLEKAKREYPKGTKFRSMYDGKIYTSGSNPYYIFRNVYVKCGVDALRCIYDLVQNRWAEIIKEQETIPLKILNNKAEDIFHISKNGDIVLRGKVIANDIELSEILTNLNNKK